MQALLDELREKHGVVGATLGVLQEGRVETAASGLLNLDTRVECTPGSVFQIGSISKVFTATLIMQLVERGRLDLDAPVKDYLRDFALADADAARTVTVRQLLDHTSGIDGDFFPADDPEGPSTLSYVRKMCLLGNLYPPGAGPMTYSNSGFVVAGRIIEVLTGLTWHQAVMDLICDPLHMPQAFANPKDSLRFRCAMGHVPSADDASRMVLAEDTYLPLGLASAGAVLTMSAESLLLFARAHMSDGAPILSAASVRRMREETVPVPPFTRSGVDGWGLGWFVGGGPGYRMVGHDGGTGGHFTYLRTFPDRKLAFTLLTNSPSDKLYREIEQHLMQSLLSASLPADPAAEPFEPRRERYVGRYRNAAAAYRVSDEDGQLRLHFTATIGVIRDFRATLAPYRPDTFELQGSGTPLDGQKIVFLGAPDDGHAQFLRMGGRMGRIDS